MAAARSPVPDPAARVPGRGPKPGWSILGPGGGGCVHTLTINPHRPGTMVVSCDMGAGYITHDGGESWREFNLRTRQWAYAFDPVDPDCLYAGASGLFRSEDDGESWQPLYPDPADVVAETRLDDESVHLFETKGNWPGKSVAAVLVDPEDRKRLFLVLKRDGFFIPADGFRGRTKRGLIVRESRDGGRAWTTLAEFESVEAALLDIDPGSLPGERSLLLFTESEVFRITCDAVAAASGLGDADGPGAARVERLPVPEGLVGLSHASSGRLPAGGGRLFFLAGIVQRGPGNCESDVFRSDDGCRSWKRSSAGLAAAFPDPCPDERPVYSQVSACATDARRVWAVAEKYPEQDSAGKRIDRYGILRSDDAGETWTWVVKHDDFSDPANRDKGWAERDYGGALGDLTGDRQISPRGRFAWDVVASPVDPDTAYTMDFSTVYATRDGGSSWRQLVSTVHPDGSVTSRGLDVTVSYGVVVDPFDPGHLAIPSTDMGLFHSENGGSSWRHDLRGVPREWINSCYWVAFDPAVRGRAWSAWTAMHNIPRLAMLKDEYLEHDQGGICKTDDGLRSWRPSAAGLPALARCTHILLDPASPVGMRTLYAAVYGDGVYKSVDDGASWRLMDRGWDPRNRFAWRLCLLPGGELYAAAAKNRRKGQEWPGTLYRSRDGARSWEPVAPPGGVDFPFDLSSDPAGRLYLAAWPRLGEGRNVGGGAYASDDGGAAWRTVLDPELHVVTVTVDQERPSTLYASTFDAALFRSDDRGLSWSRIEAFDFQWAYRPAPDLRRPGMLYVTTFGAGIWHGPAGGLPR